MGFGGISIWQLVIVLGIIILLFGTKKLRNLGGDLGSAVKGFKKAMNDDATKVEDNESQKAIGKEDSKFTDADQSAAAKTEQKSDK